MERHSSKCILAVVLIEVRGYLYSLYHAEWISSEDIANNGYMLGKRIYNLLHCRKVGWEKRENVLKYL